MYSIWSRADTFDEPLYSSEDLFAICGVNTGQPREIQMADVLARLVDGSRFKPFKPQYGESLLCGWAQLEGHPVAVVANNHPSICSEGVSFDWFALLFQTLKQPTLNLTMIVCGRLAKVPNSYRLLENDESHYCSFTMHEMLRKGSLHLVVGPAKQQ